MNGNELCCRQCDRLTSSVHLATASSYSTTGLHEFPPMVADQMATDLNCLARQSFPVSEGEQARPKYMQWNAPLNARPLAVWLTRSSCSADVKNPAATEGRVRHDCLPAVWHSPIKSVQSVVSADELPQLKSARTRTCTSHAQGNLGNFQAVERFGQRFSRRVLTSRQPHFHCCYSDALP